MKTGWAKEIIHEKTGIEMVFIPAGEFMMGSPENEEDRKNYEGPQHRVRITQPFCMGVYEVTQGQYEAVMGVNPARFKGPNIPVEYVSWNDAQEFCRKLSAKTGQTVRLPTEAEWEYACRAGTTTRFYSGNADGDLGTVGWYDSNSDRKTHAVSEKKPNGWGLYDMHGNVWEWCQSRFREYPYRADDGQRDLNTTDIRVLRGGSWFVGSGLCRSASRIGVTPMDRSVNRDVGFRVVCDGVSVGTPVAGRLDAILPTGRLAYAPASRDRICIKRFPGGETTQVPLPAGQTVMGLQWSTDGQWLTFYDGKGDILVVRTDGSEFRNVTQAGPDYQCPSFSPDASRLIFSRVYTKVFLINRDGSGLQDLGSSGHNILVPRASVPRGLVSGEAARAWAQQTAGAPFGAREEAGSAARPAGQQLKLSCRSSSSRNTAMDHAPGASRGRIPPE